MLDEMTKRNTSEFAIFLEYENPCSFFRFSFRATLFFPLMNALVYVDLKNLTRSNGKNPGFKPGSGTRAQSLVIP